MDDRTRCDAVLDRLPDRAAGRLDPAEAAGVDRHLAGCAACRAERDLVAAVLEARPEPPPGLAARIQAAVREDRAASAGATSARPAPRPRWTAPPVRWAAAAAVVVLAVGGALVVRDGVGPAPDTLAAAAETAPTPWPTEDVVVAGAPLLDDLTDDDLTTLLEELGG